MLLPTTIGMVMGLFILFYLLYAIFSFEESTRICTCTDYSRLISIVTVCTDCSKEKKTF